VSLCTGDSPAIRAYIDHLLLCKSHAGLSDGQVGEISFWKSTILDSGTMLHSFKLQSETALKKYRNVALRPAE
jgi:hypothetical protein